MPKEFHNVIERDLVAQNLCHCSNSTGVPVLQVFLGFV